MDNSTVIVDNSGWRSAPLGPEFDEHGAVCLQYHIIERGIRYCLQGFLR